MSAKTPKIMLRVELLNNTDVSFMLTHVTNSFSSKLKSSKFFFSENNWTIYFGENFHINKRNIICLPKKCERQKTKVTFNTNDERYTFLKNMVHALESWSNSHLFDDNEPHQKTIKFYKTIWILL